MAASFEELNVLLAKLQSAKAEEATGLVSSDFLAVGQGFELGPSYAMEPMDFASGTFGQAQNVFGGGGVDIKINMPVIPTASTTEPDVGLLLKCSGMEMTPAMKLHTYAFTSTPASQKDVTLWKYSGQLTASEAVLTKAHSAQFDFKLSSEAGKSLQAEFTGKGVLSAIPAVASYVSGSLTLPTVGPAYLKATTMKVCTTACKVIKFELTSGNTVVLVKDPSTTYGFGYAEITKRQAAFTATVIEAASFLPHTNLEAGTLGDFDIVFGSGTDSKVEIVSTAGKTQLTSVKHSSDEGVNVWELTGIFVDNALSIKINLP